MRQGAAERLGWNATLWDENGLPEIFVRMWEDLTDAQREDAGTLGYGKAEWEAEYTSSSDEEIPMTAADRAEKGARVPLSEQIEACLGRWWQVSTGVFSRCLPLLCRSHHSCWSGSAGEGCGVAVDDARPAVARERPRRRR